MYFGVGDAEAVTVYDMGFAAYRFGASCKRQEEAANEYTDTHRFTLPVAPSEIPRRKEMAAPRYQTSGIG